MSLSKSLATAAESGPELPPRHDCGVQPCQSGDELSRELAWFLVGGDAQVALERVSVRLGQELAADLILISHDPLTKRFSLLADSRGLEAPRVLSPGHPLEQACAEARMLRPSGTPPDRAQLGALSDVLADYLGSAAARVQLLSDEDGQAQGAVVLAGVGRSNELLEAPDEVARMLARFLRLLREAADSPWKRIRRTIRLWATRRRRRIAGAVAVSAAVALVVPAPHDIKASCQCEPGSRRFVVAPFEGQLLTSHVRPGDRVQAEQVIAAMDGSELRSKVAAVNAELEQARQRHSSAAATGDASAFNKERLEVARLKEKLEVLQQRERRLQLRSPTDGIVISGDLEQAEGAALVVGQTLFEIAPLDSLIAEIAIDESDVRFVSAGQHVCLALQGDFGNRHQATIDRVHPRAEQIDGRNAFIADAVIADDITALSPGMQGRAWIRAGRQPLGWILFHKPYLALARFWGWY